MNREQCLAILADLSATNSAGDPAPWIPGADFIAVPWLRDFLLQIFENLAERPGGIMPTPQEWAHVEGWRYAYLHDVVIDQMPDGGARLHRAIPADRRLTETSCLFCGDTIHAVQGGHGRTWAHSDGHIASPRPALDEVMEPG